MSKKDDKYNETHREQRKELSRLWRLKNKEKKRIYDLNYQKGIRTPRKVGRYFSKKEHDKNYRERPENKIKIKAREKLKYAIKCGIIIREICEIKNCHIMGEGHHEDYTKPLDVVWLCRKHHEEYHHS